jgi:hypothetical protein
LHFILRINLKVLLSDIKYPDDYKMKKRQIFKTPEYKISQFKLKFLHHEWERTGLWEFLAFPSFPFYLSTPKVFHQTCVWISDKNYKESFRNFTTPHYKTFQFMPVSQRFERESTVWWDCHNWICILFYVLTSSFFYQTYKTLISIKWKKDRYLRPQSIRSLNLSSNSCTMNERVLVCENFSRFHHFHFTYQPRRSFIRHVCGSLIRITRCLFEILRPHNIRLFNLCPYPSVSKERVPFGEIFITEFAFYFTY